MSRFPRYAAAVVHLGLRQAGQSVICRTRRHTWNFASYVPDAVGDLGFAGHVVVPLLVYSCREKAARA
jgi:hypothetical protein